MSEARQTICLCMIVKNEAHVMERCLDSVMPLIDCWVIVDTGSSDGTQALIRDQMRGVPGELFERPWVNFAQNRSESLALARRRAEYVLLIDADEVLEYGEGFWLPELTADAYQVRMRSGTVTYYKTQLVRDSHEWYFRGVVHEYICSDKPYVEARLEGLQTLRLTDGARSRDPLTYRKDALLLEEAVLVEPANARHMFYLAQSYADAGETVLAIDRYERRIAMGGWAEEVWYSRYQVARLKQKAGRPWAEVLEAYLAAYSDCPERAEPMFHLGLYYSGRKEFGLAYLFLAAGVKLPFPERDTLFVDKVTYEVLLPLEYSVACFYVGRHQEAIDTADRLLASAELTLEMRRQIETNREFSVQALRPNG